MKACKYCIRYKDGYCTMLKQTKGVGDCCKLFEGYHAPTLPLQQNKVSQSKNSIDWNAYLLEVAKTMMPSFAERAPEEAAEQSVSYAQALILKLKETLQQGY